MTLRPFGLHGFAPPRLHYAGVMAPGSSPADLNAMPIASAPAWVRAARPGGIARRRPWRGEVRQPADRAVPGSARRRGARLRLQQPLPARRLSAGRGPYQRGRTAVAASPATITTGPSTWRAATTSTAAIACASTRSSCATAPCGSIFATRRPANALPPCTRRCARRAPNTTTRASRANWRGSIASAPTRATRCAMPSPNRTTTSTTA